MVFVLLMQARYIHLTVGCIFPVSYDMSKLYVPGVLLEGNHAEIARWRRRQALLMTRKKRPDLLSF